MMPISIHDNKFTEDRIGIVAGNIPVLVERNDFINAREADVHLVGAGAVIRGNRINGGASMGIVAENATRRRHRRQRDRGARRLRRHGARLGQHAGARQPPAQLRLRPGVRARGRSAASSTAVENTIIEPKFNGIDVIGDSPILRRNQVLRPHAYALHVEDFQPPSGQKVQSQPFLDNNNFGNSPVSSKGSGQLPRRALAIARRRCSSEAECRKHAADSSARSGRTRAFICSMTSG